MYAIVKQHCISNGPAMYLDIVSTDEASWCLIPITAERFPIGNIETRGVNLTVLCAHNLPFNRRSADWKIKPAENFTALYMTNGRELFSIKYDGKKAVLTILDVDGAEKLYQELPQKLLPGNYIFDPATYKVQVKRDQENSDSRKAAEKEAQERDEEYKKNSALYVESGSSL